MEEGHFNYRALRWILGSPEEQPGHVKPLLEGPLEGILWMEGDVVLNYWNLAREEKVSSVRFLLQ